MNTTFERNHTASARLNYTSYVLSFKEINYYNITGAMAVSVCDWNHLS